MQRAYAHAIKRASILSYGDACCYFPMPEINRSKCAVPAAHAKAFATPLEII